MNNTFQVPKQFHTEKVILNCFDFHFGVFFRYTIQQKIFLNYGKQIKVEYRKMVGTLC